MSGQDLLKNWLRKKGMTAKDLAEKAGTNHSGIYRYLNGDTGSLRVSTAFVLAKATGFSLDVCDLLGIQPRIVCRCSGQCHEDLQQRESGVRPYKEDAHTSCGVNTSSLMVESISTLKKTKAKKESEEFLSSSLALLAHWTTLFERDKKRVKLTTKRKSVIRTALEDWSLEELMNCISGHSQSPWRHEAPNRNELKTLLRAENIEAGLEAYIPEVKIEAVDTSWAKKALKEIGDENG